MNHPTLNAYQQAQKLAITPSAAESATLIRAAGFLDAAKTAIGKSGKSGKSTGGDVAPYTASYMATYAAALKFNQTFWTVLQADLASDANKLDDDLKTDLLSLSVFVDKQTIKALADPKPEHLDVLIDINRNLAQGLNAQAG